MVIVLLKETVSYANAHQVLPVRNAKYVIHVHQTHVKTTDNVCKTVMALCVDAHLVLQDKNVKFVIHAHQTL